MKKSIITSKEYKKKFKKNKFYVRKLRKNATKAELEFIKILENYSVKFIFQKGFIAGNFHCIVDFYIVGKKICIEIDGLIHSLEEQIIRDNMKTNYLTKSRGFKLIRITNEDVLLNKEKVIKILNKVI